MTEESILKDNLLMQFANKGIVILANYSHDKKGWYVRITHNGVIQRFFGKDELSTLQAVLKEIQNPTKDPTIEDKLREAFEAVTPPDLWLVIAISLEHQVESAIAASIETAEVILKERCKDWEPPLTPDQVFTAMYTRIA